MTDEPLNLIIICPDEMRGDCAGFMGNADIRTPALDAFAGRSTVFGNYITTFPKCVPARISMMTGRYCHTDGYRTIYQHMLPDQVSLLDRLRQRGYQTALFGKNHCWDREVFEEQFDFRSYAPPMQQIMEKYQGFRETEPDPDGATPLDLDRGDWHYVGSNTRHMSDEGKIEQAIDFLRNRRDRARPFFLQVNPESPHPVYGVEEPWYSMYDREEIRPWPHALPDGAPLPLVKQREIRTGLAYNEAACRELQAVYYGMITKVDMLVGRLLDVIEEEGLLENTVLLFVSDHGDWAGQFQLPEKWDTCFNECLVHVPFFMRAPGVPEGARVDSVCDTSDIAPTLCELLDLEPLPGMHGQSLMPLLRGEERRKAAFSEGGHEKDLRDKVGYQDPPIGGDGKQRTYAECPDTMARAKMVRTDRYKMVVREVGGNELYDLQSDPWELENRWGHPELVDVTCELMQLLAEWCLKTDTDKPTQERTCA